MNNKAGVLWYEIKAGNEQAFRKLYEDYAEILYTYGMKIVADDDRVVDAIQELFAYIFEKRAGLSCPVSVKAYLMTSLKRMLLNQTRTKVFNSSFESLSDIENSSYDFRLKVDYFANEDDNDHLENKYLELQAAVDTLSSNQQEALYLKFYNKLSTEEIAEVMNVSHSVVYATIKRALIKLRKSNLLIGAIGTLLYYVVI